MDQNDMGTAKSGVQAGSCLGMVEGVRNTMLILNSSLPEKMKICLPPTGIKNGQAVRVVVKYLNDNPEKLNEDSTLLTMLAIAHAYPCK